MFFLCQKLADNKKKLFKLNFIYNLRLIFIKIIFYFKEIIFNY